MNDLAHIKAKLSNIPSDLVSLDDYRQLARDFMPPAIFEYIDSGAGDEFTLRANRSAFDTIHLYNRVLTPCGHGNTNCTILGQAFAHPLMLAPVAHHKLVHPQGELATAAAASATDSLMVASTLSSVTLEDIAAVAPRKWFQLYFQSTRADTLRLVERAVAAGYSALLVTVDVPISGLRNRTQRAGFRMPEGVMAANLGDQQAPPAIHIAAHESAVFQAYMAHAPDWDELAWLAANCGSLPILVKGITHPHDAQQVAELGLAGVVVSNHGGRSLDGLPASIACLAAVRDALGAQAVVLLDGGVRRGTDVFKALALGADAVLVGRPQIYALAVAGALGVAHMLRTLREELELCMALSGCARLTDIGPHALFSPQHSTR